MAEPSTPADQPPVLRRSADADRGVRTPQFSALRHGDTTPLTGQAPPGNHLPVFLAADTATRA